MELSVLIPAYLEEENLRLLLPRIKKAINEMGVQGEILVVDTIEPMDNTKEACEEQGIKYLNRKNGNNYGDAICLGVALLPHRGRVR